MITSGPCPSLHPLTSVAAGQLPLIATLPQPWVDRGKQGMKRSVATDGRGGIPLHLVAARAIAHDSPLLEPTLAAPWPGSS